MLVYAAGCVASTKPTERIAHPLEDRARALPVGAFQYHPDALALIYLNEVRLPDERPQALDQRGDCPRPSECTVSADAMWHRAHDQQRALCPLAQTRVDMPA
jgi:hypothetical protein